MDNLKLPLHLRADETHCVYVSHPSEKVKVIPIGSVIYQALVRNNKFFMTGDKNTCLEMAAYFMMSL